MRIRRSLHTASLLGAFVGLAPAFLQGQTNSGPIDFRFAPPEWQTAICLPDDPQKSLVDRSGELLYHYNQGGREFGTRVGIRAVAEAAWEGQKLHSPRVPIVRTTHAGNGWEVLEESFAIADSFFETNGTGRADLILVTVKNTGTEPRKTQPQIIVDTVLPFVLEAGAQRIRVNDRETITCSLRMGELAAPEKTRQTIVLEEVTVPPGESEVFFVAYNLSEAKHVPHTIEEALAARKAAIAYWLNASLPYGRIEVPDPGIQALIDSSIRNIWQAREIKKGLTAFQVGPTCYRGLWIVDGAFLLEAAALLGAGPQARNGVAYELTYQQPDGGIHVMDNYSKENGIVLWTCVRHAQLTQDKPWLESVWPKLERIAEHIRALRAQTLTNSSRLDDGLVPAGFPDGGIGGVMDEYSNPYWNLTGLRAFAQAATWLGKTKAAAEWQKEYKDFLAAFHRAAKRDMKTDSCGNAYLPTRMDGQDLPQRGQWAFCQAVYPGQIFARTDPLVASMLQMLEATEREGMVYGTGWDATGIWNYFASFYGHAWLWQGNGQKAAGVLTAFANHAAPVLDWREEQSLKGEKFKKVGDMPHNWASAEFIRLTVHLLALDRGDELHLLEGLPKEWTRPGMRTRLKGIATPFGPLTMQLQVDASGRSAILELKPIGSNCRRVVVHLPNGGTRQLPPAKGGRMKISVQPAKASNLEPAYLKN